jgi:hypothetical protein
MLKYTEDSNFASNKNIGELEDRVGCRPSFLPFGKAGGLHIRRCQGLAVDDYGGTLGALALKPSGFCNIGVTCPNIFDILPSF